MTHNTRRDFIKQSVIGTTGAALGTFGMSAKSYAAIQGANDRIGIAVIGVRKSRRRHRRGRGTLARGRRRLPV